MGLDIKSLLAGALGGKLAGDHQPQVIVVPQSNGMGPVSPVEEEAPV